MTVSSTPPALRAYRSRHTIQPVREWSADFDRIIEVCIVDSIRVYPVGGRMVHDRYEIRELVKRERGEEVPW